VDPVAKLAVLAAENAMRLQYRFWFWGEAIAFDAIVQAADVIVAESLRGRAERALVEWSHQLLEREPRRSDVYAPLGAMLRIYELTKQDELLKAAVKIADWIVATPADSGAHLHHLEGYPPMVFVDFMYYVGPYLAQLATVTGRHHYMQVSVTQTLGHLMRLQDPKHGLVSHVYDPARRRTNGVAWGRGNGWALLGLVDTLALLPAKEEGRDAIEEGFRKMLKTCVALQDHTGMWHTVLDDPQSPLENSIGAFFYAAMVKASRAGLVDAGPLADSIGRAWCAVATAAHQDGTFPVSTTEWPSEDPKAYYRRPIGINPWGQGCFLRAACEYLSTRRPA
jgi:unsaturated rhamnogalacturonyl hydrolase